MDKLCLNAMFMIVQFVRFAMLFIQRVPLLKGILKCILGWTPKPFTALKVFTCVKSKGCYSGLAAIHGFAANEDDLMCWGCTS